RLTLARDTVVVKNAAVPAPARLAVTAGVTTAWDGTGELVCEGTGRVDFYASDTGGAKLPAPVALTQADLAAGKTVYAEATAAGAATLRLKLEKGNLVVGSKATALSCVALAIECKNDKQRAFSKADSSKTMYVLKGAALEFRLTANPPSKGLDSA